MESNIWFTSDLHFNHDNIIKYCNRPCSVKNHTKWLLSKFSDVRPKDTIYCLGDLAFKLKDKKLLFNTLSKLPGNWKLILGNHDLKQNKFQEFLNETYLNSKFTILGSEFVLNTEFGSFYLNHYQKETLAKYSYRFHGHTHSRNKLFNKFEWFDVGIDNQHRIFNIKEFII